MNKLFSVNDLLRPDARGARIVPVSRATLYRMIADGKFPKQRRLGKRSVWTEEAVAEWRKQWLGGK